VFDTHGNNVVGYFKDDLLHGYASRKINRKVTEGYFQLAQSFSDGPVEKETVTDYDPDTDERGKAVNFKDYTVNYLSIQTK